MRTRMRSGIFLCIDVETSLQCRKVKVNIRYAWGSEDKRAFRRAGGVQERAIICCSDFSKMLPDDDADG